MTLESLSPEESIDLLRTIVGVRVDEELDASRELAQICAHLPLALRIAAERAVERPYDRLSLLVAELKNERSALNALDDESEGRISIISVFSWSYRNLTEEAQRAFRLLSLHPGTEFSTFAAAAMLQCNSSKAGRLLQSLSNVHMLEEIGPTRYRFHDLLRAYAKDLALSRDDNAARRDARIRVTVWYVHTADVADQIITPHRRRPDMTDLEVESDPPPVSTRSQAIAWCDNERSNLVEVARQAAADGDDHLVWRLPIALWGYFNLRKPWTDWIASHQIGLEAARRLGDRAAEGWLLNNLGNAYQDLQEHDEAMSFLEKALTAYRETGDRWGEAFALLDIGTTFRELQEMDQAIDKYESALELFRSIGERWGEAETLNNLGEVYRRRGLSALAASTFEDALTLRVQIEDSWGEAQTLHSISELILQEGKLREAIDSFERTVQVRREIGDRHGEAVALQRLGEAMKEFGMVQTSRSLWYHSHQILVSLNDPRAAEVESLLAN